MAAPSRRSRRGAHVRRRRPAHFPRPGGPLSHAGDVDSATVSVEQHPQPLTAATTTGAVTTGAVTTGAATIGGISNNGNVGGIGASAGGTSPAHRSRIVGGFGKRRRLA